MASTWRRCAASGLWEGRAISAASRRWGWPAFRKIARVHGGFGEAAAAAGVRVPAEPVGPQIARAEKAFPHLARLEARAVEALAPDRLQDVCLGGHRRAPIASRTGPGAVTMTVSFDGERRSSATSAKIWPVPSRIAASPVNASQRLTVTST